MDRRPRISIGQLSSKKSWWIRICRTRGDSGSAGPEVNPDQPDLRQMDPRWFRIRRTQGESGLDGHKVSPDQTDLSWFGWAGPVVNPAHLDLWWIRIRRTRGESESAGPVVNLDQPDFWWIRISWTWEESGSRETKRSSRLAEYIHTEPLNYYRKCSIAKWKLLISTTRMISL